MRILVIAATVAVLVPAGSSTAVPRGEELVLLSAVGMRQVMAALGPSFERETGHRLAITFNSGAIIQRRVQAGETADLVIVPRPAIDDLVRSGAVEAASVLDVAKSTVGLAVRKGGRRPDISSPEALKRVLLAAKSIARPDPALGGSSGVHIAQVLERLGIAEALRSRTILASHPDREHEMPGAFVASGRAEIALHQIQELLAVPGIAVVGALPGDLAGSFLFSAGILTASPRKAAGRQFLEVLKRPETLALIKRKGMQAVVR